MCAVCLRSMHPRVLDGHNSIFQRKVILLMDIHGGESVDSSEKKCVEDRFCGGRVCTVDLPSRSLATLAPPESGSIEDNPQVVSLVSSGSETEVPGLKVRTSTGECPLRLLWKAPHLKESGMVLYLALWPANWVCRNNLRVTGGTIGPSFPGGGCESLPFLPHCSALLRALFCLAFSPADVQPAAPAPHSLWGWFITPTWDISLGPREGDLVGTSSTVLSYFCCSPLIAFFFKVETSRAYCSFCHCCYWFSKPMVSNFSCWGWIKQKNTLRNYSLSW